MAINNSQNIFNSRRGHVAESPNYERFYRYLQQSISYQLAIKQLQGDKKAKRDSSSIPDFEQVLITAANFGDVNAMDFPTWWFSKGLLMFGERGEKPQARVLLETGIEQARVQHALLDAFLKLYGPHGRVDHATYYIELPKSLSRAEMIAFVSSLHNDVADDLRLGGRAKQKPKYEFIVNKINRSTLDAGYKFLDLYQNSYLEMWRIAAKLNLSLEHQGKVDSDAPNVRFVNNDVKIKLSITAHKLKHKAILLAEHAARGRFPCIDSFPFELPVYRKPKRKMKSQA